MVNQVPLFTTNFVAEIQAKNLGFVLDATLSCRYQINKVCRFGYFMLSNLWRISSNLTSISIKTQLVHSCILSHIDYCNALYYGVTKSEIYKLQRLMNSALRFIHDIKNSRTPITPYMKMSHFLPVHLRIKFKICVLVFKCLNNSAPQYLQNLIALKVSLPSLRVYNDVTLLQSQSFETLSYKQRRFSQVAPKFWNELPISIRTLSSLCDFKNQLKTHLYNQF